MKAPKLGIIATGGTFSGLRTDRGYAPSPVADRLVGLLAESSRDLDISVHEFDPPIDSADATPETWQRLIDAVDQIESGPILVIHGTDTMAYSAAALAFTRPRRRIVFTGAQRPISYPGSDGTANLTEAVAAATDGTSSGTSIAFGGRVIPATRAVKDSTLVGSGYRYALGASKNGEHDEKRPRLTFTRFTSEEIPVLRVYPGITAETAGAILDRARHAAVLDCYGTGNVPASSPGLLDVIARGTARGLTIVAVSQSIDGGVELNATPHGTNLAEAGVTDGGNLTLEAAHVKLHFLLGCGLTTSQISQLIPVDIAGELGRNPEAP
ncbi:L-asparaginase [Arthrobacter sp. GAS37]|uniref:asparaginase domain-containing protein n=1 Tax=Arthrobacter sp. GAS37 TaxID=3156261 RepID=UPI00383446EC